jgi:DNA-binding transcriptional LysR family regulator
MNSPKEAPTLSATQLHRHREASTLDANALELFARVVAAGSFSRAARQLGLTRAAVSRRGDALQGRLRITSMRAFGTSALLPLLAEFGRTHPGVAMELMFTERRVDLVREGVDVAFRIARKPPEDCVAQPVLRFSIGAYGSAPMPLAGPQALQQWPLLMLEGGALIWPLQWHSRSGQMRETVELQPHISADSLEALVALARLGQGVVLAPDFCVQEDVAAGRLHNLPVLIAGANARALVRLVAQRLEHTLRT